MKTYISDTALITSLGFSPAENFEALKENKTGLKRQEKYGRQFYTSTVDDGVLEKNFRKEFGDENFTRLEKMLMLCLKELTKLRTISEKSLLVLSTTKGNVSLLQNNSEAPAESYLGVMAKKIADFFGFTLTPLVVSNACVSGVMAVSVAQSMIKSGYCSDAFVIAGDEVTDFVLSGFSSFQAMSSEPCRPYDKNRDGISIGEAAAAVYITNEKPATSISFEILGQSSINDANHISGPHREGEGLYRSINNALEEAGIAASEIDYISAHGTATVYNDEMESYAFSRVGLSKIPLNSLKSYYGHSLGASGLLELIMAAESAKNNLLIKNLNFEESGVSLPLNIISENTEKEVNIFLKTASGFGGSNSAIILKKIGG